MNTLTDDRITDHIETINTQADSSCLSQTFHNRARSAGDELRKLLISLSTGAIGVFFLALTGKVEPPLSLSQKWAVISALIGAGLGVFAGLISWLADSQRYYWGAKSLECRNEIHGCPPDNKYKKWIRIRHFSDIALTTSFTVSIIGAICYAFFRLLLR